MPIVAQVVVRSPQLTSTIEPTEKKPAFERCRHANSPTRKRRPSVAKADE
jgi:hypothetical protein